MFSKVSYPRGLYQDAYIAGLSQPNSLISQSSAGGLFYQTVYPQNAVAQQQDWSRPNMDYQQYQRGIWF